MIINDKDKTITIDDKTFIKYWDKHIIEEYVDMTARFINENYKDSNPIIIVTLSGALFFASDLMKKLNIEYETAFTKYSSYQGGTSSTGKINKEIQITKDCKDREVLILEDIIDTGLTMQALIKDLRKAKSIGVFSVVSKEKGIALIRNMKIKTNNIKYIFSGTNAEQTDFLLGYGMDYKDQGRNLLDIYKLCE